MRWKSYILSIILAMIMTTKLNNCFAQNIYANGSIDRDSVFAGQPFNYKIDVSIPNSYVIDWDIFKDTLSKNIEIIKRSEISSTPINNNVIVSQTLTLASFDTGYIEIPPIGIKYSKSANDTATEKCFTEYMYVYVEPVSIDTTTAYKPIKMPIKQNITFIETTPFIGVAIILAALVLLTIHLIRRAKNKEKKEEEDIAPSIPAIITAREKLSQLKDSNLWQSGKSKEYYTDLTDIVREYLEGQFSIDAVEMTSDDILIEVKKLDIDKTIISKFENTLITADLVKFAKANPNPEENETAFNNINTFVEESYIFHQEMERRRVEEAKTKKYEAEKEEPANQEMEESK